MQLNFFPSRTITFYMMRLFVTRILGVLFALVLILQALDLLGESGKILAVPGNTQAEVWQYLMLRVPQIIARFLPFSVLLATIITLATLNQNSEVISMKAAGLSAHQVLAPLVLTSLFIAIGSFAFNERIVTRSTATLDKWQKLEYKEVPPDTHLNKNVYVNDGPNIVRAETVLGQGDNIVLKDITVYRRDGGTMSQLVYVKQAKYVQGKWVLSDSRTFDVSTATLFSPKDITITSAVTPDRFTLQNVDADGMDARELRGAIQELKVAGRPTAELEAAWWHKFSGPLSSVLMPLLGAVAAFGLARSGALFLRAVIGMGLGFAYFVADNFALAMGNIGSYPPFLAAWGPFFLFLLIGETVLIRTEE